MTSNTDHSVAFENGRKAINEWSGADDKGAAGDAYAILALYLLARDGTFTYPVPIKGTKNFTHESFTIPEMATDIKNEDGKTRNNTEMTARSLALFNSVFSQKEEKLPPAHKTRMARCLASALLLSTAHKHMDDSDYIKAVQIKTYKGKLCLHVPTAIMAEAPKDTGDNESELATYEATKNIALPLDGKQGNSLTELGKRAKPPVTKRVVDDSKKPSAGVSLLEIVKTVRGMIQPLIGSADNGSTVAPDKELRDELFAMQTELASYFAADKDDDISDKINASKRASKTASK